MSVEASAPQNQELMAQAFHANLVDIARNAANEMAGSYIDAAHANTEANHPLHDQALDQQVQRGREQDIAVANARVELVTLQDSLSKKRPSDSDFTALSEAIEAQNAVIKSALDTLVALNTPMMHVTAHAARHSANSSINNRIDAPDATVEFWTGGSADAIEQAANEAHARQNKARALVNAQVPKVAPPQPARPVAPPKPQPKATTTTTPPKTPPTTTTTKPATPNTPPPTTTPNTVPTTPNTAPTSPNVAPAPVNQADQAEKDLFNATMDSMDQTTYDEFEQFAIDNYGEDYFIKTPIAEALQIHSEWLANRQNTAANQVAPLPANPNVIAPKDNRRSDADIEAAFGRVWKNVQASNDPRTEAETRAEFNAYVQLFKVEADQLDPDMTFQNWLSNSMSLSRKMDALSPEATAEFSAYVAQNNLDPKTVPELHVALRAWKKDYDVTQAQAAVAAAQAATPPIQPAPAAPNTVQNPNTQQPVSSSDQLSFETTLTPDELKIFENKSPQVQHNEIRQWLVTEKPLIDAMNALPDAQLQAFIVVMKETEQKMGVEWRKLTLNSRQVVYDEFINRPANVLQQPAAPNVQPANQNVVTINDSDRSVYKNTLTKAEKDLFDTLSTDDERDERVRQWVVAEQPLKDLIEAMPKKQREAFDKVMEATRKAARTNWLQIPLADRQAVYDDFINPNAAKKPLPPLQPDEIKRFTESLSTKGLQTFNGSSPDKQQNQARVWLKAEQSLHDQIQNIDPAQQQSFDDMVQRNLQRYNVAKWEQIPLSLRQNAFDRWDLYAVTQPVAPLAPANPTTPANPVTIPNPNPTAPTPQPNNANTVKPKGVVGRLKTYSAKQAAKTLANSQNIDEATGQARLTTAELDDIKKDHRDTLGKASRKVIAAANSTSIRSKIANKAKGFIDGHSGTVDTSVLNKETGQVVPSATEQAVIDAKHTLRVEKQRPNKNAAAINYAQELSDKAKQKDSVKTDGNYHLIQAATNQAELKNAITSKQDEYLTKKEKELSAAVAKGKHAQITSTDELMEWRKKTLVNKKWYNR